MLIGDVPREELATKLTGVLLLALVCTAPTPSAAQAEPVTETPRGGPPRPASSRPVEPAPERRAPATGVEPAADTLRGSPRPPSPSKPIEPDPGEPIPETQQPTGYTAWRKLPPQWLPKELSVLPNRWLVGFPDYHRYGDAGPEAQQVRGVWWNPYRQNVLKGDYPIYGQHTFLDVTVASESTVEGRRLPTPSDVSTRRPDSAAFFGQGEQLAFQQNFILSANLFHGNAAFKPRDWELRVTPVFNINYLAARENGVVNINPARGTTRFDSDIALQELFGDVKILDTSPYYDRVNLRGGIQGFISDFRGFVFADFQPGFSLFANSQANRNQYRIAYFRPLDKDVNSGLNTLFRDREQDLAIASFTRQDFIWEGYFTQLSVLYNNDHRQGFIFDVNGFLVRPAAVGDAAPHRVQAGYLGWTGDGHIQRVGVSHAFFQALGHDERNPIAGKPTNIMAQMAALELSYERDWLRFKGSMFWASGDDDPTDDTARGFDAIFDNPQFVGGPFSFWQRQGIRLTGTNTNLTSRFSLLPSLRSNKEQGQANFVNPGIFIFNFGVGGRLTPKLRFDANLNYLRFAQVEPLQLVLLQSRISHEIGFDYGIAFTYRPLMTQNIIAVVGAAALTPLSGFEQIFESQTLYQAFMTLTLTF